MEKKRKKQRMKIVMVWQNKMEKKILIQILKKKLMIMIMRIKTTLKKIHKMNKVNRKNLLKMILKKKRKIV